jgi:hypothetical protein
MNLQEFKAHIEAQRKSSMLEAVAKMSTKENGGE